MVTPSFILSLTNPLIPPSCGMALFYSSSLFTSIVVVSLSIAVCACLSLTRSTSLSRCLSFSFLSLSLVLSTPVSYSFCRSLTQLPDSLSPSLFIPLSLKVISLPSLASPPCHSLFSLTHIASLTHRTPPSLVVSLLPSSIPLFYAFSLPHTSPSPLTPSLSCSLTCSPFAHTTHTRTHAHTHTHTRSVSYSSHSLVVNHSFCLSHAFGSLSSLIAPLLSLVSLSLIRHSLSGSFSLSLTHRLSSLTR